MSMTKNTTLTYWKLSMGWTGVDKWADIPPSDDALKIRFLFCKETQHALGTREDVCEGFEIPLTEKVITICPSQ
ncbi:hypothetical protein M0R45_016582 [Rubus argutus]|uniref:Uncharacterized protein n=1 Tax=Rubus argutus TaxID=59490 RepID=A0AAW1XWL7_RUBAR